jgi:pilus assembly protein CpaE
MPELSVVVITTDEEQKALLQLLVDGTVVARMTHSFATYPQMEGDPIARRLHDLKADVILVDLVPGDVAAALRAIELLHTSSPKSSIFAIGPMAQPQLIVDAMRAGAREFLARPTSTDHLLDSFNRLVSSQRRVRGSGKRGGVISVLNAKGGSGATSVAVNTALSIAMSQGSTALLDMAPLGTATLQLNVKPAFTIVDSLNNLHRLDGTLLDGFMTRHESGLHLLAGDPGINLLATSPSDLARLLDPVVNQYRHVVIDISTRLDATARTLCELSDTVLVVATPDLSALWSAARLRDFFAGSPAEPKLRIVLNRYRKIGGFGDSDVEQATRMKIVEKISNQHAAMSSAIERGVPVARHGNSELTRSFAELAKFLTPSEPARGSQREAFSSTNRLTMRTHP